MNRQEQLRFCKACLHQKIDTHKGIVCSITGEAAAFEVECTMYKEDKLKKHQLDMDDIRNALHTQEADKGKRFLNLIIDRIFMIIMTVIIASIYGVFLGLTNPSAVDNFEVSKVMEYVLGAIISIVYYTLMEATTGRTIGKLITKTKVVDTEGNKPDFGTIFIRSLSRIVPFDALSFLFGDNGWHDSWSNTRVVEIKK